MKRILQAFALLALIVSAQPAQAGKTEPLIAQPLYEEAYFNLVFRKAAKAIKPLTHLVKADPELPDFHNALALALFIGQPEQHELAFQHAEKALALDPDVPQFIVTHVLTDRSQWKIEADGTARLSREAAERLIAVRARLLDMPDNARKLGKLLNSIEEKGGDPDFPFVFADYKKLMKRPSLALTRPPANAFDVAQKSIVDKIINLREQLEELKKQAQADPAILALVEDHSHEHESRTQADFATGKAALDRGEYGLAFHTFLALARAGDVRAKIYLTLIYEKCLGVLKHAKRVSYIYGVTESQKTAFGKLPHYESDCIDVGKKVPAIAQPMYLEAYTQMIFRKSEQAIKPLTHLVEADPYLSHIRNALAVALIVARPEQHELAFQHAKQALALDPTVPQFTVTHVLTDRSQWKIEADGTARLSPSAAERLLAVRHHLLDMSGYAKKLGKLLNSIEKRDADPEFPFVFADYKKLMKKPSLLLTRPPEEDFEVAQRSLVDNIFTLRKMLDEDKKTSEPLEE